VAVVRHHGSIGSIGEKTENSGSADPSRDLAPYRERHRANPKVVERRAIRKGCLSAEGQNHSGRVLEKGFDRQPRQTAAFSRVMGRAMADNGNFQQPSTVLGRGSQPRKIPIGRILRFRGTPRSAADTRKRGVLHECVEDRPDEQACCPSSGLYGRQRICPGAEETLARHRLAAYIRASGQHGAVVGMQGRPPRTERIRRRYLAAGGAAANVANLKRAVDGTRNARAEAASCRRRPPRIRIDDLKRARVVVAAIRER